MRTSAETPTEAEQLRSYRYERKFFVPELSLREIERVVYLHPALFREIYHERFVNSMYFDTPNLASYRDNLSGFSLPRRKVRIRWYGDAFGLIERPTLEVKIRRGLLIQKISGALPAYTLDEELDRRRILDVVDRAGRDELRSEIVGLHQILLNRYRRRYYRSADGRFRITVDWDLSFVGLRPIGNTFVNRSRAEEVRVVELKYAPEADDEAASISQRFPFRVTRGSKYVSGIDCLCLV